MVRYSDIKLIIFYRNGVNMRLISIILLAFFYPLVSFAQTSVLTSIKDATLIQEITPELATGSSEFIFVGRIQRDLGIRRGLVQFDLSTIPANAKIQSVVLKLFVVKGRADTMDLKVHRVTNSWGEGASNSFGGAGGAAAPNDATWVSRFFGTTLKWTSQGGDFLSTISASKMLSEDGNLSYEITDTQLVSDVIFWLNNPGLNHGWLLEDDTALSAKALASRQNANATIRPQLIIQWTPPALEYDSGDVPLPLWMLVMLAGGLFYLNKRHKN
jgi:hypothetical protein